MSQEKISISVVIASRTYRMKVSPDEEARVLRAAELIHDKLDELQSSYNANDRQDYLAMAFLMDKVATLNQIEDLELARKENERLNAEGAIVDGEVKLMEDPALHHKLSELDEILTLFLEK